MAAGAVDVTVAPHRTRSGRRSATSAAWRSFFPGIESFRLEGDDRIIGMFGMEIRERLLAKDEENRVITYSVVEGVPIDSHTATISVEPDGEGSKVIWAYDVTPDEMAPIFGDTYKAALATLAELRSARRPHQGMGGRGEPLAYPDPVNPTRGGRRGWRQRTSRCAAPAQAPRPLTEDVPRIYPRRLPDPTRRELVRRGRTIAKVVAVHFTPTASASCGPSATVRCRRPSWPGRCARASRTSAAPS